MSERPTRRSPEMEKYVEVKPAYSGDGYTVHLQVKNQRFHIAGCDNLDEAEYMRDMLCIALAGIVAGGDNE